MFDFKQIKEIKNSGVNGQTYTQIYEMGRDLYNGDSFKVFQTNEIKDNLDEKTDYISFNIFAQIVDTYTNLAFYEKPKITFKEPKNQEWFDEFANEEFYNKLTQLFQAMCFAGDSVCYLNTKEDTELPELIVLPNTRWIPLFDENRPDLEAKTHLVEFTHKENQKNYKIYQFFTKIYENGEYKCQTGFVAFEGDKEVALPQGFAENLADFDFSFDEETQTYFKNIDHELFFRFKNKTVAGEYFGRSDFTNSILSKAKVVNKQLKIIDYVLTKVSDPMLLVDKHLIENTIKELNNEKTRDNTAEALGLEASEKDMFSSATFSGSSIGSFNLKRVTLQETLLANRIVQRTKIIPYGKEDGDPKYIGYDPHTDKQTDYIKELLALIYKEKKISPVLFETDFRIGSMSGTALQRLIQETLHETHTKEIAFETTLKNIIYNILKMAGLTPEIPTIEWYDGIIDNRMEKIEEVERLLMNEFITKKEAIKQVLNLTDEQAEAILKEIEKEKGYPSLMNAPAVENQEETETES